MRVDQVGCGRRVPAAAVFFVFLTALPTSAQDDPEAWITIGSREAAVVKRGMAEQGARDELVVESDGAVVVARVPERRMALLSRVVHEKLRRCGGFVAHESRDAAYAAVAREAELQPSASLVDYTIDNGAVVQSLVAGVQEANVRNTISTLAAYFTRYHNCPTGTDSANWIRSLWQGYAQGRSDVTVELFTHPAATTPQPSVILTIQGTVAPSEVVVLGAHQDSIAGSNCSTSRAPGADDDASGVASLSEVIRVALAQGYRPQRTVKFMAYAAEEVGLRGSQDIATQYRNANVNVVGVLQLDMTNYKGTPSSDIVFVTDNTNAAQNTFLGQLVDTYLGLPRTTTTCGYGCSDHASWNTQGYAASIPFEAVFGQHNQAIHTANDTLAQSGGNANHALKFTKLAAAYLAELAKGSLTGGNQPPSANAGPDRSSVAGASVSLSGSGTDPEGAPLSFAWSQVSGPAVTITNPNQATASVAPATAATYTFRLTVSDGALTNADDMTLTVTDPGGGGMAAYDATLRAPRCATVGTSCDSGTLVNGRGTRGPEPNQPNTTGATCADGTSGTYHVDESNDRVKVVSVDGTAFATGKSVRIDATVWAYSTPSSDAADFFYAADATDPSWTLIGTVVPTAAGAQTLSRTYTLPAGANQAVRVQFRYQGTSAACASGGYNDRDDLVFAVGAGAVDTTLPTTSITSPLGGATISGTTTITANASDNVGVTQVDFYAGATLLGSDTTSPYAYPWTTTTVANGSYSLTTRARDAAGNVGTSTAVAVTVNNTSSELIANGGFDTSTTGWTVASNWTRNVSAYMESANINSMAASNTLYQTVAIPTAATGALTFGTWITTQETTTSTVYDRLYVEVRNTSGTLLATLATYSNVNKSTGWVSRSLTVPATYKGQTVRLQFRATSDGSLPTVFRVDTVSLK